MSETTQRAYSMRLKADEENRKGLIALHLAGNRAVGMWANHLLTLRGGIQAVHAIQDDPAIARWRRIAVFLSWFSVESRDKAPEPYRLSANELPRRFVEELEAENIADLEGWLEDCQLTMHAAIRDDSVWVDRRAMFRGSGLTTEDVWDLLDGLFGGIEGYFAQTTGDAGGTEAVKVASQWLSSRFGVGKGSDFEALAQTYLQISEMQTCPAPAEAREIFARLSQPGPSNKVQKALSLVAEGEVIEAEAWASIQEAATQQVKKKSGSVGRKGPRDWSDRMMKQVVEASGIPYNLEKGTNHAFHTTVLDQSARRVVGHHRLLLNQERDRLALADALPTNLPPEASDYLERFVERKRIEFEAVRPYAIRGRALNGWPEIVEAWGKCDSPAGREKAVKDIQASFSRKFGDAQLFLALAADEALPVWRNGVPDPEILQLFAKRDEGREELQALKVISYRHNDALRHPVFIEFGSGRLKIRVKGQTVILNCVTDGRVEMAEVIWQSNRIANRKRRGDRGEDRETNVILASLEDNTNGRLMFDRETMERIDRVQTNEDMSPKDRKKRVEELWRQAPIWLSFSARISTVGAWAEFAAERGLPRDLDTWLYRAENKTRKGRARLSYSRIPGVRLLGVDLRMRHGAAVALWEALSPEDLAGLCAEAGVTLPGPDHLSLCLRVVREGKTKRLILRRTGPDVFPDGAPNPTSWAWLRAKKRIEVQGEADRIRKAAPSEIEFAETFFEQCGLKVPEVTAVDELQEVVMRRALLELRRHSDYAELGWSFGTDFRVKPNGEKVTLTQDELIRRTVGDLRKWHKRAFGRFDDDRFARSLWEDFLGLENRALPGHEEAKKLMAQRSAIAQKFSSRWELDELEWPKLLAKIQDWILPRASTAQTSKGLVRHTGGLSLKRIRRIDDLARLVSSFRSRPTPLNPKIGRRSQAQFVGERSTIRAIAARLKEERCRQIAAAIVKTAKGTADGFEPAHAIVIENLSGYRPNRATRTREENRRIAEWCASRTATHIQQGAERNGIRLIEIVSQYSSVQFAATGEPGLPCQTVSATDLLQSPFWIGEASRASKKADKAFLREKFLLEMIQAVNRLPERDREKAAVVLPMPGGKEIVSVSGLAQPTDLNAAANIGLKPLLDPDGAMAWWYVPLEVQAAKTKLSQKDVEGSLALGSFVPSLKTKKSGIVNAWRDLQPSLDGDGWLSYEEYLQSVEERVIEYLRRLRS